MTCNNCLALLLDAEPEELGGNGTSAVAAHVRECARCAAVAAQLARDTAALAAAIEGEGALRSRIVPPRRRRVRAVAWGGALAVAAVLAIVLVMPDRAKLQEHSRVPSSLAERAPSVPAPVAAVEDARPLVPLPPHRFPDVVAATPARLVASHHADPPMPPAPPGAVAVSPPDGKRAFVLASKNADVTVVWLY